MLTTCPVCDYPLAGLPAAHRCPECGFEFDELTRAWRWTRPRWMVVMLIVVVGMFVLFVPVQLWALFFGRAADWLTCFSALLYAGLGALAVRDLVRGGRRHVVLATGANELIVRQGRVLERIPWANVWGATWAPGAVTIHRRGLTSALVLERTFATPAEFAEFEELIRRRGSARRPASQEAGSLEES